MVRQPLHTSITDGDEGDLDSMSNDEEMCSELRKNDIQGQEAPAANQQKENDETLLDCLAVLMHAEYNLIDAYPIAPVIPVTSLSVERSFSALKKIKSRIRSFMIQETFFCTG